MEQHRSNFLITVTRNSRLVFISSGRLHGKQASNGQAGIFILGAVSFTVGLVTEEVVQLLTNFVKGRLGIANEQESKKLAKSTLSVLSTVQNNPIVRGNNQVIKIIVSDSKSKESIARAIIHGSVIYERLSENLSKLVA